MSFQKSPIPFYPLNLSTFYHHFRIDFKNLFCGILHEIILLNNSVGTVAPKKVFLLANEHMVSENIQKLRGKAGIEDKQQWRQLRRDAITILEECTSHLSTPILRKNIHYTGREDAFTKVIFPCNIDS